MWPRTWMILGALLAAAGVAAGAYHAHGLERRLAMAIVLGSPDGIETQKDLPLSTAASLSDEQRQELARRMSFWDTATRYQMYHAIGLVLVGLLAERRPSTWATLAGVFLLTGIVLFSGLLDVMAFGGPKWLGAIVPLGGLSMIAGWLALACSTTRRRQDAHGWQP